MKEAKELFSVKQESAEGAKGTSAHIGPDIDSSQLCRASHLAVQPHPGSSVFLSKQFKEDFLGFTCVHVLGLGGPGRKGLSLALDGRTGK